MSKKLLTLREAMAFLRVSRSTLYRLMGSGQLRGHNYVCAGPNANTGDADFIVERPSNAFGVFSLANFGSVQIYGTYTNKGAGDADISNHFTMKNGSTFCATAGYWYGQAFTVFWDNYCS